MAVDNQQNPNQEQNQVPSPTPPVTTDKGSESINGESSSDNPNEKTNSGFNTPRPFIVKIEKEQKKGWLKTSEFISLFALLISITAVVLNKCSLDNTSRALAITDNSFKRNIFKDSLTNIDQIKKDSIAQVERKANRKYVDSTLSISNQGVNAANRSSQIAEQALNETKKSYEFGREAVMYELRAYQTIIDTRLINFQIDSVFRLEVDVINKGKTPAQRFKCVVGYMVAPKENLDFVDEFKKIMDTSTVSTIQSEQSSRHFFYDTKPLKKGDIDFFNKGVSKFFIIVSIEYYDIFNKYHFTHRLAEYLFKEKRFNWSKIYNDSN